MQSNSVQKITPEKVVDMLANDGITVSLHEAELMLEFMYPLAEIALDILLEKDEKLESE